MAKKKVRRTTNATREKLILIYGGIIVTFCTIVLLHDTSGFLGDFFYRCSRYLLGDWFPLYYFIFICVGVYLVFAKRIPSPSNRHVAAVTIILITVLFFKAIPEGKLTGKFALYSFFNNSKAIFEADAKAYGGAIGNLLYSAVSALVSYVGAIIVGIVAIIAALILLVDFSKFDDYKKTLANMQRDARERSDRKKKEKEKKLAENLKVEKKTEQKNIDSLLDAIPDDKDPEEATKKMPAFNTAPQPVVNEAKAPAPVEPVKVESVGFADDKNYKKPRISAVLEKTTGASNSSSNKNNARSKGEMLIGILDTFGIPSTLEDIHIGPSVTKFEVKPQSGIKVSKITALQEDIKMALAVTDVRIEAPVPGKSVVGIEIPNVERSNVRLRELLEHIPAKYENKPLLMALGKDLSGECVYAEIDKMPHMLIAGSTGSGKSVCINSIITTLLLRTTPSEVKMLLIDPKKVEFTPYYNIPNLIGPVISEASEASKALATIVSIMENRYETFRKAGVRNITEYNAKAKKPESNLKSMYYIVVIIDELADLMVQYKADVETNIQRITQLARASGIHLIVATQRPSTDVITGTIKTNIPSRIAFAVSSAIDSRIILDQTGAESLLGYGDMLFIPIGDSNPKRVQGVYVSDEEIRAITDFVATNGPAIYDDAFVVSELDDEDGYVNGVSADPLYDRVKQMVIETRKASTSSIQRYFGIGYNRAARIMDFLEKEGVIGPANGSKPREVLMKSEYTQDMQ